MGFPRHSLVSAEVGAAVLLIFVLSAPSIPPSVSAQGLPFTVAVRVYDEGGNPVGGASVNVTTSSHSYLGSSDAMGWYVVIIDRSVDGPGSTITVYASKGLKSGSNSSTVPSDTSSMRIDVTISGPVIVTKTATATTYVLIFVVDAVVTNTMTAVDTVYATTGTQTLATTVTTVESNTEFSTHTETHTFTESKNVFQTETVVSTSVTPVVLLPMTATVSFTTTNTKNVTVTEKNPTSSSGGYPSNPWILFPVALVFSLVAALVVSLALGLIHPREIRPWIRRLFRALISTALPISFLALAFLALAFSPRVVSAEAQTSTVTTTKISTVTATSYKTSIVWITVTSSTTVPVAETIYSTATATSLTAVTKVYTTTVYTTETRTHTARVTTASWTVVTSLSTLSSSG